MGWLVLDLRPGRRVPSVDHFHGRGIQCNHNRRTLRETREGDDVSTAVKARVVRIGNSRGIRIPKVWLEQLEIGEEVELSVHKDRLTIRPARRPRQGWAEAFRRMAAQGDDRLLDQPTPTRWQAHEWEW